MRLVQLALRNYRNYGRLDLVPSPDLNLFLGRNGQGKTNLLESIAILALSTSPRARRDSELIGPMAAEARIEAVVETRGRRLDLAVHYREDAGRTRRRIEVGGQPRRAVDLPGALRVTLFWPDDLNLVKAGPEHRRRLLNQLLVQVEPGYARDLARYQRILEQRNHLLKQAVHEGVLGDQLDVWDLELVEVGARIAAARAAAVAEIGIAAAVHQAAIGGEELDLRYQGPPADLAGAVRSARQEDLRRGISTVGPHRDDVVITFGGRDLRAYGSQGQQRTAVVSIKLAEADVVEARTEEPPVLLLDDVLSELDPDRRAALMERIAAGGQVVVTSAESGPFTERSLAGAVVRCVEQGVLSDCG